MDWTYEVIIQWITPLVPPESHITFQLRTFKWGCWGLNHGPSACWRCAALLLSYVPSPIAYKWPRFPRICFSSPNVVNINALQKEKKKQQLHCLLPRTKIKSQSQQCWFSFLSVYLLHFPHRFIPSQGPNGNIVFPNKMVIKKQSKLQEVRKAPRKGTYETHFPGIEARILQTHQLPPAVMQPLSNLTPSPKVAYSSPVWAHASPTKSLNILKHTNKPRDKPKLMVLSGSCWHMVKTKPNQQIC